MNKREKEAWNALAKSDKAGWNALAKSRSGLRKCKEHLRNVLGAYDLVNGDGGQRLPDSDEVVAARKFAEPGPAYKGTRGPRAKVIYP